MVHKLPLKILIAACILLVAMATCNRSDSEDQKGHGKKTSLEISLDSAEILFLSPKAEKIVSRIRDNVLFEKDLRVRARALRIFSMVLLSKVDNSAKDLDSAALYAIKSQELALANNDSVEWALSTVQLERHYTLNRQRFGNDRRIGVSAELEAAMQQLEKHEVNDGLSLAYRTLAIKLDFDSAAPLKVLRYELLSLQFNDSVKYPVLRARICNDIAVTYVAYFRQPKLAERFFLRAIEILKNSDDYDTYSIALNNLAVNNTAGDQRSLYYSRLAARVAAKGNLPQRVSSAYFMMALKFQSMGLYDSALFYQHKSSETLPKDMIRYDYEITYRDAAMAKSYLGIGKVDKAARLTDLYAKIIGEENAPGGADLNSELATLAGLYQALGDYEKLARTQTRLLALRDSIFSKDRLIAVGRVEGQYDLELKNKELKVLQMSNELNAAQADREMWVRFLLITTAIITTFGLLIVVKLLTQQSRLNDSLAKQNATIERQKLELENSIQDLHRAQAHVLNSEKMAMLGQFTAGVAHELNNPLNFISGGVSVLEEAAGSASTEEVQILKNIRNGVDRAIAIVNSLRVFSNPRSEIGSDSQSDLTECINASLLVLQSKIKREGVKVVTDFTECIVTGHSGQLCQVFINLIDNAIHAVRDLPKGRKTIEIRSRTNRSNAFVEFHDSGVGIPDSIQANLFQAFFTTKPAGQGIGLGLFICDTILRGIGGTITVSSQVDQGSTFTVQFICPK